MGYLKLFITGLIILSFLPTSLYADPFKQAHISVSGNAVKSFKPDVTHWNLSLRTEFKDAEGAARQHALALSKVLGFLKNINIPKN